MGRLARPGGLEIGLTPASVDHLLRHYGTEAAGIYNLGAGEAEVVVHAVRREMAQTVEDVMVRRTHLYYETPDRRGGWRS